MNAKLRIFERDSFFLAKKVSQMKEKVKFLRTIEEITHFDSIICVFFFIFGSSALFNIPNEFGPL